MKPVDLPRWEIGFIGVLAKYRHSEYHTGYLMEMFRAHLSRTGFAIARYIISDGKLRTSKRVARVGDGQIRMADDINRWHELP